ncbi:hypothetical protein [Nannocystis bainbridge]|uniref:Uncharacterized protein n=1 Tax=Nannocystis bainbridge TaxID=2995303 RepID=A0ABT5DSW0_9BACT|nr:hypothetical protein [Nannocystis bainbridge]MDC0716726.1 hypothetical protein [Nannocystis bainbridge]
MRLALPLLATTLALAACPGRGSDSDTDAITTTTTTATTDTTATTTDTTATTTTTTTASTDPTAPTTALTGGDVVPCEDRLPPAGSPCAVEGEVCQQGDDLCVEFVGATCEAGAWVHFTNQPGAECEDGDCDPSNPPLEGDPCAVEGASCSTDCSDQCSFCNAWVCSEGAWQRVEVFPEPCLECEALCDLVIVPMCAGGPPDPAACVAGCEESKAGACKAEFSDLRACAGEQPTFTCDAAERPLVAGCEDPFAAFYACSMP